VDRDLNDIAVFVRVVESRSFTGAGNDLGVPRSTVSRRVAQLEKRLGVRLLHRTTRRIELTDVGAAFFETCSRSIATIEEAEQMVLSAQATPRGRLRVTAPGDIGVNYLAPLVTRFLERFPQVRIDVELTQRVVDLVAEGFDIALRAGSLPDSSLIARRIGQTTRRLYASPAYLAAHGEPESPDALRDHACVLANDRRISPTWKLQGSNGEIEVPVGGPVNVNDFSFAKCAALAGAGIAFLPAFTCREEEKTGALRHILTGYRSDPGGLFLVYPSAQHLSATVRAFRDFVLEHADELPHDELA
jgi:DNA-binding transcriptional LysR family regulator